MSKVLVRKALQVQQPVGAGAPILVVGGNRGPKRDARTLRESTGGLLGQLAGTAGAFAGQHQSLGSLVQSMISGGAQGKQIGESLGRVFVGPESQARANIRQDLTDRYASARAAGEFDRHGIVAGKTPRTRVGAMLAGQGNDSMMARRLSELEQAKQSEKDAQAMERQRQEGRARVMGTEAAQQEMDRMRTDARFGRQMRETISGTRGMSAEEVYERGNQFHAAYQNQQNQGIPPVRVEAAGPTPNVNAANEPVQVIGPNTPPQALPPPANVPTVGQEIAEEEKTPTGDEVDHDGEYQTFGLATPQQQEGDERMSEQQRKEIERQMMQGRVGVQPSQPQDNMEQTRLDDF